MAELTDRRAADTKSGGDLFARHHAGSRQELVQSVDVTDRPQGAAKQHAIES